ncbi:hypothetical protein GCM10010532_082750 [Dactylosporangium siamense]
MPSDNDFGQMRFKCDDSCRWFHLRNRSIAEYAGSRSARVGNVGASALRSRASATGKRRGGMPTSARLVWCSFAGAGTAATWPRAGTAASTTCRTADAGKVVAATARSRGAAARSNGRAASARFSHRDSSAGRIPSIRASSRREIG